MSPHDGLYRAESLYLSGYTTYPRTESTSYPESFNFKEVVQQLKESRAYGNLAAKIKTCNPRKGTDAGDHPPITPTALAYSGNEGVYNIIAQNFIASLLPDAEIAVTEYLLEAAGH